MSGGENQRVTYRTIVCSEPQIASADEPSGSLDNSTGDAVMELLFKAVKERSIRWSLTYNQELAHHDETWELQQGTLHKR